MRLRTLVLAACAAVAMAMPSQAQVPTTLNYEWHLISVTTTPNTGATGMGATARTNVALAPNHFQLNPLNPGDIVYLQLMIRDTHPMGKTYNWGFGNGVYPPVNPFNGTGFSTVGGRVVGSAGVFQPAGTGSGNARFTAPIDSELAGPNPTPGANYPLPDGDFTGVGAVPYSGIQQFVAENATTVTFNGTSGITDGNPWENGEFPRLRGASTEYLMPVINMRFNAIAAGSGTLQLLDLFPTNDNGVSTDGALPGVPGGDMLDSQMFGSYVPLQITVVPEPTSMTLVGMALAGLGYRKLRRKKTTEVVA